MSSVFSRSVGLVIRRPVVDPGRELGQLGGVQVTRPVIGHLRGTTAAAEPVIEGALAGVVGRDDGGTATERRSHAHGGAIEGGFGAAIELSPLRARRTVARNAGGTAADGGADISVV